VGGRLCGSIRNHRLEREREREIGMEKDRVRRNSIPPKGMTTRPISNTFENKMIIDAYSSAAIPRDTYETE
jgi:hypothetical protein